MIQNIPLGQRRSAYLGSLDISGANNLDNEVSDVLASPFIVKRVFLQVTTAATGATSSQLTVTWRPTPGSATGALTIGVITVPAIAVDLKANADMYQSVGDSTVISAGGQTSQYGIGGQKTYDTQEDIICGPGGEIRVASDGGLDAGVVGVWVEVMPLPFNGAEVEDVTELTVSV